MLKPFFVKGVTSLGRLVEFAMLAESEGMAKAKAKDLGLDAVAVRPIPPETWSQPVEPPAAGGDHLGAAGGRCRCELTASLYSIEMGAIAAAEHCAVWLFGICAPPWRDAI